MTPSVMKENKIVPTEAEIKRGLAELWSLELGMMSGPRLSFYGRTIREAIQRARKSRIPWLDPKSARVFSPQVPKKKRFQT